MKLAIKDFKTRVEDDNKIEFGDMISLDYKPIDDNTHELLLPKGYEIIIKNNKPIIVKKEIVYPKTYKECCDVLLIPPYYNLRYITYKPGYNEYATSNILISLQGKLNTLGKLLICRDAYWKIAGEKMELGKSWEPDLTDKSVTKYILTNIGGEIHNEYYGEYNGILAFPTNEIRNIFYANFKDLIEQCKELL